jgi:hypothetical protein
MTLAQVEHEFHGSSSRALSAAEVQKATKLRVKTIFDNVCIKYKLNDPKRLLLIPPKELVRMIKSVDEKFRKTGVDEKGASNAAKMYLKLLNG